MSQTDAKMERYEQVTRSLLDPERANENFGTRFALRWLILAALFGILLIALYSRTQSDGLSAFGVGALAALAAMGAGSAIGLLFSVPRALVASGDGGASSAVATPTSAGDSTDPVSRYAKEAAYRPNSNLERVSDWLATIIVGVTLTQFDSLMTRLDRAGEALSLHMLGKACGQGECKFLVVGHSILISYFLLGFLIGYLWVRRYLLADWIRVYFDLIREQDGILKDLFRTARVEGKVQEKPTALSSGLKRFVDRAGAIRARITQEEASTGIPAALRLASLGIEFNDKALANDDPWKGVFGGLASNGGYQLTASVSDVPISEGIYRVVLSIAGPKASKGRKARFFLHDTFGTISPVVEFDDKDVATLRLLGYGAFTVGAAVESRETQAICLEFDLQTLPDLPPRFRAS